MTQGCRSKMTKFKVLHIHTLPVVSGSGINTYLTMRGVDRRTYESELACAPGGRLIDLVQKNSLKVTTFEHMVQPLHPVKDMRTLLELVLFLKKNPYHLVHTHNSKGGFLGRLAAKLAGVPAIVHTVHGFAFHDQEPPWRKSLFRNMERLAARWCDKMIFISRPLIEWALRERVVSGGKIVKIYSGIELDRFQPRSPEARKRIREKWGLGRDGPVIGIVSKLWEGKGHEVLIEAVGLIKRELENVRLVIVGEGYLLDRLVQRVEAVNMRESVLFTGFQMDVQEILSTFDVAVLPSFFEGMGRVLLEAMAMEKPVVASRVGGIPDLVAHGVNGLLVQPGDVQGLACALKKILLDKGLAEKMGKEGRKRIRDQFSSDVMVRSIEEVYKELLARKGLLA